MIGSRIHRDDFERLYAEHAGPLLAFLTYRTGDETYAEDLLADTFERVLRARRPFDPRKGSEKTWLYTIALNRLRDEARRAETGKRTLERVAAGVEIATGGEALDDLAERDALYAALNRLTPDEQEAVALRFGAQMTLPEIAKVTRNKPSTIHGRLYRALRKLRAWLDPD